MENDFFNKVYRVVRLVPAGRVTTYGAVARYVGSPQSSRMVGYAMNGSFSQNEFVPAHRVVNRNGQLTGKRYFGGPDTMKELLQSEGIVVENDEILNFSNVFWDPNKELLNY